MKKENITIDSYSKLFNETLIKIQKLKDKLELEMTKINEQFDNIMKQITKSYEIKHEKLYNEENKIKEELQIEVTKIKEKLELFTTKSNEMIRISNKINKGMDKLKNYEDNNIIKIISYISKLNKSQKEMNNLFKELIKNTNISFLEDENEIKYEDYYFNGIQTPKDIEFKNIDTTSAEIFWKIDEIKFENIDNNIKTNFKLEIRKDNSDDDFKQIYEGNNKNYKIYNLDSNTSYQIRIDCLNNNLIGNWSQIYKFKTNQINVDSIILKESKKASEFLNKIYERCGYKKIELLFRATKDGATADDFHKKCDNQGPTLCLYKNDKGNIFGGYAPISWTNKGGGKTAPGTFIFTLTNIYNAPPTIFNLKENQVAVFHYQNEGPVFGKNAILIKNNFIGANNVTYFPENFKDNLNKGKSIFTGNENNDYYHMDIKEIEVFKIS